MSPLSLILLLTISDAEIQKETVDAAGLLGHGTEKLQLQNGPPAPDDDVDLHNNPPGRADAVGAQSKTTRVVISIPPTLLPPIFF